MITKIEQPLREQGKRSKQEREALLLDIPRENINLYAEIEVLIKFLKVNESTETEEGKRKFTNNRLSNLALIKKNNNN